MSAPVLSTTRWHAAPEPNAETLAAIHAQYNLHPAIARIAARRIASIDNITDWFSPLVAPFCDPMQFTGMQETVTALHRALTERRHIVIFGDYDTDGITATTLLSQALKQCDAQVNAFIPDRETEGYGLTTAAINRCLTEYPDTEVLITVDCGISCVEEVADLQRRGIEVIITDHHLPPETLPQAQAILNPRLGAPKGAEMICGCATAYVLVRALYDRLAQTTGRSYNHKHYLDLVAVATIADVMPLTGENRSLVTKGLYILGASQHGNPGLHALAESQSLKFETLTAEQIAFKLVPCINAASRIGECNCARDLLAFSSPAKWNILPDTMKQTCRAAALQLKAKNQERREIENYLRDVIEMKDVRPCGNLVLAAGTPDEGFHPGVLGIVAARLSEQFKLSAVVCSIKPDGSGSGSVRARGRWNAVQALDTVRDLLAHYGGHTAAAGFSLIPGTFEAFKTRFPKAFEGAQAEPETLYYDESLHCIIDSDLLASLDRLEPFGNDNPKPIFAKTFILNTYRTIGADKSHLDLTLRDPAQPDTFTRAVWFGAAERSKTWLPGTRFRFFFTVSRDNFHPNRPSLQLIDAIPCD